MHDVKSLLSSSIKELTVEASVPRYLAFCLGLDRDEVHAMRNAYKTSVSQCSSILCASSSDYEVKIIGFYTDNLERIFNSLGLTPNLLIVGKKFQGPYPAFVKEWIMSRKPSILRIDDEDADPSSLSHDDYYIKTYAVVGSSKLDDSWRMSNEIDYGILVNLNYRRIVKIEDYDHHVICLDDIDIESSFDASSLKDSSAFDRESLVSAAALFFNDKA